MRSGESSLFKEPQAHYYQSAITFSPIGIGEGSEGVAGFFAGPVIGGVAGAGKGLLLVSHYLNRQGSAASSSNSARKFLLRTPYNNKINAIFTPTTKK